MNTRIETLFEHVKSALEHAEHGHDVWHALRVCNNAITIFEVEGGNKEIIEAASLLHDVADSKFYEGNEEAGIQKVRNILENSNFTFEEIEHILQIITCISFKGGLQNSLISTVEFKIVQDADRLDALGAIGVARTFHYGGFKNREMYNPQIPPKDYTSVQEYRNSEAPTINHFYEKLFKLKDLMNTKTAKHMAQERHEFMELYLQHFFKEWGSSSLH